VTKRRIRRRRCSSNLSPLSQQIKSRSPPSCVKDQPRAIQLMATRMRKLKTISKSRRRLVCQRLGSRRHQNIGHSFVRKEPTTTRLQNICLARPDIPEMAMPVVNFRFWSNILQFIDQVQRHSFVVPQFSQWYVGSGNFEHC
jgi:hypothetical protein